MFPNSRGIFIDTETTVDSVSIEKSKTSKDFMQI